MSRGVRRRVLVRIRSSSSAVSVLPRTSGTWRRGPSEGSEQSPQCIRRVRHPERDGSTPTLTESAPLICKRRNPISGGSAGPAIFPLTCPSYQPHPSRRCVRRAYVSPRACPSLRVHRPCARAAGYPEARKRDPSGFARNIPGMRRGRPPRGMTASSLWRYAPISGGKLWQVRGDGPVHGQDLPCDPLPLTADWGSEVASQVPLLRVTRAPGGTPPRTQRVPWQRQATDPRS